ncbi:hypothetical protein [Methanoplanus limicola]|uniref:Uncharacterized protein n=1 Tax=Methanoplanus limicola DSM 2279 TaxID=937775 RepID=H1YZP7_9EURY|nr:hypothetical protein [Methanoplanus limicola]EHQ34309.1 hypothetical protein Metlim_0156 [Methanoplanus limicola DSM 2279]
MTKKNIYDDKTDKRRRYWNYIFISVILAVIILFFSFAVSAELFASSDESEKYAQEEIHINNSFNYYRNEDYSQAYSEISDALDINGSNYLSLTLMSSLLLKMGDYTGCIKYSEKAMETDGRSSDPFLLKEISLLRLGFNERGISFISGNPGRVYYNTGDIIVVNTCKSDPDNYEFWKKWNRLNLWESPGSEKYIGTTNACDDVEVIVLEEREYNGDIYYRIKENNRDLSGWL